MAANRSAMKAVLLPSEHGSWAFVLEPVLLGTIMSRDRNGLYVVFGALFAFLAYRPLKLGIRDVLARKRYPRTTVGLVFGSLFLATAAVLLYLGAPPSGLPHPLVGSLTGVDDYRYAIGGFLAVGLIFAVCDAKLSTGVLGRELLGALITVPLAGAALWSTYFYTATNGGIFVMLLCVAKIVPTVLYVRARLRSWKDRGSTAWWAIGAGALSVVAVGSVELTYGSDPILAYMYLLLLARITWGVSKFARDPEPMDVGMQECGYSALFLVFMWIFLT